MDYSNATSHCDSGNIASYAGPAAAAPDRRQPATADNLAPAYNFGWSEHLINQMAEWQQCEPDLAARWHATPAGKTLDWADAREAVRAGWDHVRPPAARRRSART